MNCDKIMFWIIISTNKMGIFEDSLLLFILEQFVSLVLKAIVKNVSCVPLYHQID